MLGEGAAAGPVNRIITNKMSLGNTLSLSAWPRLTYENSQWLLPALLDCVRSIASQVLRGFPVPCLLVG